MKEAISLRKDLAGQPVLVLGKGPSLTQESFENVFTRQTIIGINQVSAYFPVDIAFFIDIEPFQDISLNLLSSTCKIILPWHPNHRIRWQNTSIPMPQSLINLVESDAILSKIEQQDRLLYFHTKPSIYGVNRNTFIPNLVSFSSLLQILSEAGVSEVKTLGIDGGSKYSGLLKPSATKTQLRKGYDKQFPILRRIAISRGIRMERANEIPLNIYIGCEPPQYLAAQVLEHSIMRNTSRAVRIYLLNESIPSNHQSSEASGRTPFSMQRFLIPKLNKYQELAIYLDSDMLVYHDIQELLLLHDPTTTVSYAMASPGSKRRPQYSMMVINCAQAVWDYDEICQLALNDYESTMFELKFEPSKKACIPYQWNSLERFERDTKLLHFTDMDIQPWISNQNPLAPIWFDALFLAIEDKKVTFDNIVQNVQRGWIRPGVLWQVEHRQRDPKRIPQTERLKDELFIPPHTVARFTRHNNPATRATLSLARKTLHWIRGHKDA